MDVKLENLIEKIKMEGVEEAQRKADEILKKAQVEAKSILDQAREKADEIIDEAVKESKKIQKINQESLQRAFRDTQLLVKERIEALFGIVLQKEVTKSLQPDFLQKLILQVVNKWENNTRIEITLSEDDVLALKDFLTSELQKEFRKSISIKISDDISKGFRVRLENKNYYYDFSDGSIKEILKKFLNSKLNKMLENKNG